LVTTQPGDASETSTGFRREKIDVVVFFSPACFPMIDAMPQDIPFTAEYFRAQISTPLHQHRRSRSRNAARRKPNLNFDNSQSHTDRSLTAEMAKLRCKRVAHPFCSPDLAICDLYLLSHPKDKLAGLNADDDAELFETCTEF
jgi:hypothetical protein